MSDDDAAPMTLECYSTIDHPPRLVPGEGPRDWMDFTDQHFAYRCTPLTIANCSGWELLNPIGFSATWTGLNGQDEVIIRSDDGTLCPWNVSLKFGHGIITFQAGYLFRTPPGWNIWVRGAPNRLKHGIQALDGIVETNWLPFSFTMNWKFTEPGTIRFEKDEPFCFITQVPSIAIERVQPVIKRIQDEPALLSEYKSWASERAKFNAGLVMGDALTQEQKWQKNYLKGRSASGKSVAGEDHRIKRSLLRPIEP